MGAFATGMKEKSDILVAVSVVFVILIMIVPLNAFFMDIFLTLSISLSILILFIGMYISKPLDFSVFPSVLLIMTLFRLSLNIATTRLVLVHGDEGANAAGYIIKGFGTFIVAVITLLELSSFSSSQSSTLWLLQKAPDAWQRWRPALLWTPCLANR
jgi:flagellar biosynthesis protein FlhA